MADNTRAKTPIERNLYRIVLGDKNRMYLFNQEIPQIKIPEELLASVGSPFVVQTIFPAKDKRSYDEIQRSVLKEAIHLEYMRKFGANAYHVGNPAIIRESRGIVHHISPIQMYNVRGLDELMHLQTKPLPEVEK